MRSLPRSSFMTGPAIDTGLMLPVAIQTPSHFNLYGTCDTSHGCNLTVTACAHETGSNMHHMRKIDEVRHSVDPYPGNRFFFVPVWHQFLNFWRILSNEQMTGPTIRHCGDTGYWRFRSVPMTEKARYAVFTGMDFMTERDRLDWRMVAKIQGQNIHEGQYA